MHFSIKDFRRIEAAAVDLNAVSIIAGANSQGKSSIAQAVSAMLLRDPQVMGVAKKDMRDIMRDGCTKAIASLHGEAGNLVMEWPSCTISEDGAAPRATPIATGQVRFTGLSSKDAARLLGEALKAEPTADDLKDAIGHLTQPEQFEDIKKLVKEKGWDAAAATILDNAKLLKGRWHEITGEAYGPKKGDTWQPADLQGDVMKMSEAELLQDLSTAQTEYENAIKTKAVDEERRRILQKEGEQVEFLTDFLAKSEELLAQAKQELEDAEKAEVAARVTNTTRGESFPCPHCQGRIERKPIHGGFQYVQAAEPVAQADEKKLRMEYAKASGHLENRKQNLVDVTTEHKSAKMKLEMAQKARAEYQTIKGGTDENASTSESAVGMFQNAVGKASARVEAYRKWRRALEVHQRIVRGLAIADELLPEGLRRRRMVTMLEGFNRSLAQLSQHFRMEPVNIDVDMNIYAGRRPYKFLSSSMQYRVDVVLQVAIAKIDGSAAIVVDGADIIVGEDRQGLLTMLLSTGIPTLLCIALTKPDSVPSVWQHGGSAYWLENSVTKRLGAKT